ncbi:Gfo/Idh/MocA family protein [Puniceicoccus vermicola]|uniref:Gfo/Idh/MocA family oxidoreductase n=1 Tax=Puniceicoccus vermicola TaxID=388746 RepID=A0A7X1E5H1_9BACT|nr:Gfo/Idh/MocA family oxidoreductase [Puniceicoccus vermicola]MBC2603139.1 Gfo/Idh/MocA family oxidoreductase [Puniceicoccus vermicola]
MAKNEDIRIGIIGVGNMGGVHAKSIQDGKVPGLKLTAIADREEKNRDRVSDVKKFVEGSELIQSDEIDAVLISTPHYSHTTLGIEALQKGLHVLVEKPISVHKEDCEKLIAAYDGNPKQIFAAMFNQRTDFRYQKARELIQSGELGEIRRLNWIITDWFRTEHYYKSGGWRATWGGEGGGVLLNQCPHQLDLWQWLFGMPSRVTARCQIGRFHDIEVEDSVTALLEYDSGVQGVFITTTGEAPGVNRLEIVGDRGRLEISGGDTLKYHRNEVPAQKHLGESKTGFEKPSTWDVSIPTEGGGEQHVGILKNFVGAITGKEKLIAPAIEGIHSVELANAMLLSGFTDKPVQVPIDSAAYAAELKSRIENSTFVKKTVEAGEASDFSKSF